MAENSENLNEKLGLKGFSDSKTYENVRPVFPREAVKLLMKKVGALKEDGSPSERKLNILELGAGTGKFTGIMMEVLEGTDVHVVASDPVEAMCQQFKEVLPEVEIMQFGAEDIDFDDKSFDVVLAPGCLHWFCNQKSFEEICRVLVPGGKFGITWNFLAVGHDKESEWLVEICEYLDPIYKENGIIWPMLHYKDVIQQIPIEMFTKPENTDSNAFIYEIETDFNKEFEFLLSISVAASFSLEEKVNFREFYENVLDRHFRKQGKELKRLVFKSPVVWCKKYFEKYSPPGWVTGLHDSI